jgi:putative tryptophan/tyrosine transport system substrate-binding protein
MLRREFITGLGSAVAWPVVARAQQADRMRRIGVLMYKAEIDPEGMALVSAFRQGLAESGWIDGRNLHMDVRWAAGNFVGMRALAKELIDLQSEVILAEATPSAVALRLETQTIPIVFVLVVDPVEQGLVASVPRPSGNLTGFLPDEPSMGGKWVQLLKEIAPDIKRVAIMFNPDTATYGKSYFLPSFEAAARSLQVEPISALVHNDAEIEAALASLGGEPGGGLVVMPDSFTTIHRALIISLAAQNNLPAIYKGPQNARDGGLLSYGSDNIDEFRRAAIYVDRILRGAKPAELPVQLPTKLVMTLNAKTAKALGLSVPQSILLRADEVIE